MMSTLPPTHTPRYLILMQDDEYPPRTPLWLHHIKAVFRKHTQLGAIGMNTFRHCMAAGFQTENQVGGCMRGWE